MQIAGLDQFARPIVKAFDTCFASFCAADSAGVGKAVALVVALLLELRPHRRTHLKPALPICAPQYFLHIFLGSRKAVSSQCRANDVLLSYQAIAQIRRQLRNGARLVWPGVRIAARRISLTCARRKVREASQRSSARCREACGDNVQSSNFCRRGLMMRKRL